MSALPPISELYRLHRQRAVAIARRIVRDPDEAEDVVQDVFTKLSLGNVRFDGASACTTWLHRIVVNSSINSLRAKQRRSKLETTQDEIDDPETCTLQHERHTQFLDALGTLSQQHRQMVTLRDVRGHSYPDIARLLGVPEGTVKSALNRARARLMTYLRRDDDTDAD
ncbi:MAG: sigma-70 family RNA polymerase sigma factor [Archangium sp.]|nr:sigma-70 family RNA polymerase sigma factor [Archangium sp.]